MSHLSAMGLAVEMEEFEELIMQAARQGTALPAPHGYYIRWSPGAGVELWVQADRRKHIIGCNPHFTGSGQMRACVTQTFLQAGRPMDGRLFAWAAPRDEANPYSGLHPLAAESPDFDLIEEKALMETTVTLQLAGFSDDLYCYASEADFLASPTGKRVEILTFIPDWQEGEETTDPKAEAFLCGRVLLYEQRTNPLTGQRFHYFLTQTPAGTIDVVADSDILHGTPATGGVIAGTCWLSARIVSSLPPSKQPPTFGRRR